MSVAPWKCFKCFEYFLPNDILLPFRSVNYPLIVLKCLWLISRFWSFRSVNSPLILLKCLWVISPSCAFVSLLCLCVAPVSLCPIVFASLRRSCRWFFVWVSDLARVLDLDAMLQMWWVKRVSCCTIAKGMLNCGQRSLLFPGSFRMRGGTFKSSTTQRMDTKHKWSEHSHWQLAILYSANTEVMFEHKIAVAQCSG